MKTDSPILVCIKRPGQEPCVELVDNTLSALRILRGDVG